MKTLLSSASSKERLREFSIATAIVVFVLFYRILTLMMIHTGVDERDYWYSAKTLTLGLPYPELTHRTVRWGVILPVHLLQRLTGTHPNAYYVAPILAGVAQSLLIYGIGKRLRGRVAGLISVVLLAVFPYMIRAGSQVRPEIFSLAYILIVIFHLDRYLTQRSKGISEIIALAVWTFIAYLTKITNLFFMPGIALAILLLGPEKNKRLRHSILYGSILLVAFLAETGLYAVFTNYDFGQLDVIRQNHITGNMDKEPVASFIQLFARYSPKNLQAYWTLPFLVFVVTGIYCLTRKYIEKRIAALFLVAASFFVGITFAVAGTDPIIPAEPFHNRYFTAVLAPVFLVFAVYGSDMLIGIRSRFPVVIRNFSDAFVRIIRPRPALVLWISLAFVAMLAVGIFSSPLIPAALREFVSNPADPASHPLVLNERYRASINNAYKAGIPICGVASEGGVNAVRTALSYYLDPEYLKEKPPLFGRIDSVGKKFAFAAKSVPDSLETYTTLLIVVRAPFRIRLSEPSKLNALEDEAFGPRNEGDTP